MKKYLIPQENMERLEKALKKVSSKCKQYDVEFSYNITGACYKEVGEPNNRYIAKFYEIEVEGTTVIANWKIIAKIEHTTNGNIISKFDDNVTIPEVYRSIQAKCDHCNVSRIRKYTYLIQNVTTGEYKQIGKSCLLDYTKGWSAEVVASIESYLHTYEDCENIYDFTCGERYINVKEYLACVVLEVKENGYRKSEQGGESTKWLSYKRYERGILIETDKKNAEIIIDWLYDNENTNVSDFVHNLKVICKTEYTSIKNIGYLAYLPVLRNNYLKDFEKRKKDSENRSKSEYIGTVSQKIEKKIVSIDIVTSYDTDFGLKFVYKMIDENGNTLIWKSTKTFDNLEKMHNCTVKATIKALNEFKGEKQTELTRCRFMA